MVKIFAPINSCIIFLVYPFWAEVYIKSRGGPVVGEGIIIPGFNARDEQVSPFGRLSRKILLNKCTVWVNY
jgi:hypothetical protein